MVHGDKELLEKLGRNDLCPCGSSRRFQELLHEIRRLRLDRAQPLPALISAARRHSEIGKLARMSVVGFSLHGSVLSPIECERLAASLVGTVRSRAGARHLMRHPAVMTIAADPRLLDLAREWVGPDAVPYRATLFDKSVSSNWLVSWHQDTVLPLKVRSNDPRWGSWSTKAGILYAQAPAAELERIVALRLHLDSSTRENGPLRVVPGSHLRGVLSDEAIRDLVAATPSTECLSDIGGIIRMRPLIVHASSKTVNEARRRVLHIEYAPSLLTLDGLPLAIA